MIGRETEAIETHEGAARTLYAGLKLEGLREAPVQFGVFADEATTKARARPPH